MNSLVTGVRILAELFTERAGREPTAPEILSLDLPAVLEETVGCPQAGFDP